MSEEQRLTTIIKWHEETEVVLVQSGALPLEMEGGDASTLRTDCKNHLHDARYVKNSHAGPSPLRTQHARRLTAGIAAGPRD